MERRRVDWAAGTWTREPATTRLDGDDLVVGASEGSDFWRTTHYGFIHDDGHGLLGEWPTDTAVEVTFDASTLTELYDQAGLLLWAGDDRWIKAGLELSDGVLHVGAVVTNRRLGLVARAGARLGRAARDHEGESGWRGRRCGHPAGPNRGERVAHAARRSVHPICGIRGSHALCALACPTRGALHAVGPRAGRRRPA